MSIEKYVKELPGEDIRRWNLEVFKRHRDIEAEVVDRLRRLREMEREAIREIEEAERRNEKGEEFIEDLRKGIRETGLRVELRYFKYAETKKEKEIILKHIKENVHKNYMERRLKEIRRALNEITDKEFTRWLKDNRKAKHLGRSRIDRIIVVVYDEDNIVVGNAKEYMDRIKKERSREHISEEIIEMIEEERGEGIDEIIEKWKRLKEQKDREGKERGGIKIRELWDGSIKMKSMFYYAAVGKPLRLEIITNVQEAVKRELWKDKEREKIYRLATWKKDSETNYILPEDIETYEKREQEITRRIMKRSKELFIEECKEIGIKPSSIKAYVSIAEICYELPTSTTKEELENYFIEKYKEYKRYAGTFIKIKYDKKTERPHLFLDLLHLNPEEPTMTFKIYPKYIHKGKIYLRREIVARKSLKYIGRSVHPTGLALNEWLLLAPKKGRFLILKFLEYQMKEKKEFLKKQEAKRKIDIYNLPNILDIEERVLINLIVNGRLPSYVDTKVKNKLMKRKIIEKKRHGLYVITPEFKETLKKLLA